MCGRFHYSLFSFFLVHDSDLLMLLATGVGVGAVSPSISAMDKCVGSMCARCDMVQGTCWLRATCFRASVKLEINTTIGTIGFSEATLYGKNDRPLFRLKVGLGSGFVNP